MSAPQGVHQRRHQGSSAPQGGYQSRHRGPLFWRHQWLKIYLCFLPFLKFKIKINSGCNLKKAHSSDKDPCTELGFVGVTVVHYGVVFCLFIINYFSVPPTPAVVIASIRRKVRRYIVVMLAMGGKASCDWRGPRGCRIKSFRVTPSSLVSLSYALLKRCF